MAYLVIRLVPDSPVDGATFATYLDGLQLQVIDAYTGAPLSDFVYYSPLTVFDNPPGSGAYGAGVTASTSTSTAYDSTNKNYGNTLSFDSTLGISVGSWVFTNDSGSTIPSSSHLTVVDVTITAVTLNNNLSSNVPAGTAVSFAPPMNYNIVTNSVPTAPTFQINTNGAATDLNGNPPTSGDPAMVLPLVSTNGVLVGMGVTTGAGIAPGTTVAAVNASGALSIPVPSITLSQGATTPPPINTPITFTWSPPYVQLTLTPASSTSSSTSSQLTFSSGSNAQGVAYGMTLSPIPGVISPGTIVTEATTTIVTVQPPLAGALASGQSVTFNFPLSSGFAQDVAIDPSINWGGISFVVVPQAVATAVIPLNSTTPYLDIKVLAIRGSQTLPLNDIYHNVYYALDALPSPDQYQSIPPNETSLYLSLPPPPLKTFVPLSIPSDGSPPPFDALMAAIQTALQNDPFLETSSTFPHLTAKTASDCPSGTTLTFAAADASLISAQLPPANAPGGLFVSGGNIPPGATVQNVAGMSVTLSSPVLADVPLGSTITFTTAGTLIASLISSPANCTRIAYDIVWSYQNVLPLPPDPLDSLYTNPPNPGGSTGSSSDPTNNLEQDRIKFEGALNSFYSTRNANAERLTKFVAAASAAVSCEATSLNSPSALLEFPVDPSVSYAAAVESELLLEGLGLSGPAGINFGVPAGFFYVLGANLDKSTKPLHRFQIATGDAIERVLQLFSTAETAGIIGDTENFADTSLKLPTITSFQAARRLAALGVSTASNCPATTVFSGTPLAALVNAWIEQTDPATTPPPNPPLTYDNIDFNIWSQQIEGTAPQGYLYLDLEALTQGYVIPPTTAAPSVAVSSGATLTFSGLPTGISVGTPVSGTNIAAGTTVAKVAAVTTVTLSNPLSSGGVKTTDVVTFAAGNLTIAASPNANIGSGRTLTFAATAGTASVSAGMPVSGPGIAANITVVNSETVTTVTLSAAVQAGGVSTSDVITFRGNAAPFEAVTTAQCLQGGTTLTFAGATGVNGIQDGMTVYGANIPASATVTSVNAGASTITISGAGASAGVPASSVITFVSYPPPPTLADEIFAWLAATTTSSPTIATLKAVTATQWTNFFTSVGNQSWLPPFTQPVPPGASRPTAPQSAAYVSMRIRAFMRAVQQFFTVSSVATSAQLPAPSAPPAFGLPSYDPITLAAQNLPPAGSFKFGAGAIAASDLSTAVQSVFPGDAEAQAWLAQAVTTINELYQIAPPTAVPNPAIGSYSLPNPASLQASVVEALYARGFRGPSDVTKLNAGDFQQALIGTVAYDFASALYTNAQAIAPSSPAAGQAGGSFEPINPDGSLVDCVPPPCLSPTGPIAYLQELLKLSPSSTCADPWAAPRNGQSTLGGNVTERRGPIGTLLASCANLETPLPLIDIVNENLESMAAAVSSSSGSGASLSGTVYNTSADYLAGFRLCKEGQCNDKQPGCHHPEAIYAALPEYSTPASPVSANQSVEPAVYNALKADFSSCCLPYSQALDVSRTYLRHFGSRRFDEMRTFRKCITEFALDPDNPPAGFQSFLLRSPVRIETAIEYLGITPEEYTMLFQGAAPHPCASPSSYVLPPGGTNAPTDSNPAVASQVPSRNPAVTPVAVSTVTVAQLFGSTSARADVDSESNLTLAEFLEKTCLTYCEFLELWKSGFVQAPNPVQTVNAGTYPECEPCCLNDYQIQLPHGDARERFLLELVIIIRLWRKLKDVCGAHYTFDQLYDIATVLKLFVGGAINPGFIRQLAAFQMLRDQFRLPLVDHADRSPGGTGAARTHILALWVGSGVKKWSWAVAQLLEGVEFFAKSHYDGMRPRGDLGSQIAGNIDALSGLANFNPGSSSSSANDTWNSTPACTLRFAEVLAKMCASEFRIGELLYLFNAQPPYERENPFAPQDPNEALNYPLDLPEGGHEHTLGKLREALLAVEVSEEEAHEWTWNKIVREFRDKFGYAPASGQDRLLSLGQHFFPSVLEAAGFSVTGAQRQYQVGLTSSKNWSLPPGSPFQYDASTSQLWIQLPLEDEAVASKVSQLPQLNGGEQAAVQDLYFAPRVDLGQFKFLFPDWQSAERHMIEERDVGRRWSYFRRHFALAHKRRWVIAEHLARHVASFAGWRHEHLEKVADLVLGRMLSDENNGTPWESDSGAAPPVMWPHQPAGGAVAALLGLAGTGLLGEYLVAQTTSNPKEDQQPGGADEAPKSTQVIWREVRAPMEAFGHQRDETNSPVPTVLPALALSPAPNPAVNFNNGYAVAASSGQRLGGAEAARVRWTGVLLIDREGEYAFRAGAPAPDGEEPDFARADRSQWRVVLKRGQKDWLVLNHSWPGEPDHENWNPHLRRGAYSIAIEYSQPAPDFTKPHLHPAHTGFQVKYRGPDTEHRFATLPGSHLYRDFQDQTLDAGIAFLSGSTNAQAFLNGFYTSTLRDIRRTYQRAFKAVLFVGGFALSARPTDENGQSELGYFLANASRFAGYSYYRNSSGAFIQHLANFDFDFLPLIDNYHAPAPVAGDRSDPSLQRTQAMFDWWERVFDYCLVRRQVERRRNGPVWRLFYDAQVKAPADPAQLLGHIGADPKFSELALRFYQDQSGPIYSVSDSDLEDERWLVRVWCAEQWIRRLHRDFHPWDLAKARPDLWASDDPSAPVAGSGTTETGNENLLSFLTDSCFNQEPRRYGDVRQLNDGLRLRGRDALIAYLCANDRVALPWASSTAYAASAGDLNDLLLLDVRTRDCEKASRIDEAITAAQNFIRRAGLGLEPGWKVTREFAQLWDSRFETYRKWELCKRRELYRENWIEWEELGKARRIEAFRFLEDQLRSSALTIAAPGGLDYWLDDDRPLEHEPELLQERVPSELEPLTAPPQSVTREGLGTLGTPEYASEPTWLAAVPQTAASGAGGQGAGAGAASSGSASSSAPQGTAVLAQSSKVQALAQAVAVGSAQSQPGVLPFWMESAMKMGTTFLRIAAAGVPEATLKFVPHRDGSKPSCCSECGKEHPALVDEYYFWLIETQFYDYNDQTDSQSNPDVTFTGSYQFGFQDPYYDQYEQQSAEWNDENQAPALLAKWQPNPAVRLAWCRVHNGQFQQPRKSDGYVAISSPADLVFLGRGADSLYFEVSGNAIPLPPGYGGSDGDTSPPGFRFDLQTDEAVALPQVVKPSSPDATYPGGLESYPFFVYDQPGTRLFPSSWFSPSLLVAETLRGECKFELALRWYKRSFDPLQNDCTWMKCPEKPVDMAQPTEPTNDEIAKKAFAIWVQHGRPANEQNQDWFEAEKELKDDEVNAVAVQNAGGGHTATLPAGACCDSAKVSDETARHRAATLHFCETLLEWAERLMCRGNCPEAFQQARLLCDTAAKVAGRRPKTILMPEAATPQPVSSFTPAYAPLNPRLMDLYSSIDDKLVLIHTCESARRLPRGRLGEDMIYFGDSPLRGGWRTEPQCCSSEACCNRPSPYRFTFQIQKAIELVGRVRELESALLAAYEKLDAEALASIHAEQEREMLALGISIRQDQWRDADWQIQALQQTKEANQTSLIYYNNLYQTGLINDETQNLSLVTNAKQTRTGANEVEAVGESFTIVPDFFVGAMSTFSQIPIGTKLAGLFETIGKVMQTVAEIQSSTAAIDMTQANWQRRSDEWFHQMQVLPIEIQQTELQILGTHRRRDQAMQELNNQQRQIEHATEVLDFLRDKFTSADLYLKLKKETAAMHARMYKLAHCAALEAQRAFNFERGHTTRHFIPDGDWDSLRDALVAGQRLQCALARMEKAYFDENVREYELAKHFSLRMHFPEKLLELKLTGRCEIELPEWMFNLDYPSHFMLRTRKLSVTAPCVTSTFTGVHCRITLLSSCTRIDPRPTAPATGCCCDCGPRDGYEGCPHDPRFIFSYGAREAIATSDGQNDSGLFELNFHDERYLPFEFEGAVSRWRIELPRENNYFPMDTLTDFIMHLSYTSREAGEPLGRVASKAAKEHLPGSGWVFFDVRHEFPDAWQLLENDWGDEHAKPKLALRLERKMFPYVLGVDEIEIDRMALVLRIGNEEEGFGCEGGCNCPAHTARSTQIVEFSHRDQAKRHYDHDFPCLATAEWPDIYHGTLETQLGPVGRGHRPIEVEFRFPQHTGPMEQAFLLCRYRRWQRPSLTRGPRAH